MELVWISCMILNVFGLILQHRQSQNSQPSWFPKFSWMPRGGETAAMSDPPPDPPQECHVQHCNLIDISVLHFGLKCDRCFFHWLFRLIGIGRFRRREIREDTQWLQIMCHILPFSAQVVRQVAVCASPSGIHHIRNGSHIALLGQTCSNQQSIQEFPWISSSTFEELHAYWTVMSRVVADRDGIRQGVFLFRFDSKYFKLVWTCGWTMLNKEMRIKTPSPQRDTTGSPITVAYFTMARG